MVAASRGPNNHATELLAGQIGRSHPMSHDALPGLNAVQRPIHDALSYNLAELPTNVKAVKSPYPK
jgi:hypothetical protein